MESRKRVGIFPYGGADRRWAHGVGRAQREQARILRIQRTLPHSIRLIGIGVKEGEPFVAQYLFFAREPTLAKTYKEQDKSIDTLTIWNVIVAHRDAPEDFIYEAVRVTFEGQRELVVAFKGAEETLPENIRHTTIPLHPGAYRFYG